MAIQMLHPDYQYYFYLRKSKRPNSNRYPIYLRLTHLGVRKDVSTRLSSFEKHWLKEHHRVSQKADNADEINRQLFQMEREINDALKYLLRTKDYFSLEDLWAYCQGERETTGLLAYFTEVIGRNESRIGVSLSKNTQKVYKSTFKHLQQYLNSEFKRSEISMKAANPGLIEGFLSYLLGRCNRNTANKYMKTLRAVLNSAIRDELIYKNPFDHVKLKSGKYNRAFLDEDELNQLLNTPIKTPSLKLAQEFLIVSCFTGMHYSDIVSLKSENLITKNGQIYILKKRVKTDQSFMVPLFPQVKKIIERHSEFNKGSELFHFYSNQKTNACLKKVAELCGIRQNITCKMGRHTFGTTVTLQNSVPIESVSKMMGHTKISTTQIYARVLESKISSDMAGVLSKYA